MSVEGAEGLRRLAIPAVAAFVVTVRIVVVVATLVRISTAPEPPGDYVGRFTEIANADGRAYRDHPVEYPPVTLAAIELTGGADQRSTGVRVVWFSLAADALVVGVLLWGWGRRAALAYLVLSLPVLGALYATLDVLPAALSVAGMALATRRRERSGGVLLAAAALAKIWPLAVVPGLLVWGRRRALAWSIGVLALGTLAWIAWAGPGALNQVATQRDSPGWESESTVGALVRVIADEPVRIVKDSPRVGVAPAWAKMLLATATVAGIALVWRRAMKDGPGQVGAPALAGVALLLFLSPIYSFPYVVWLLPWAPIALVEGRRDLAGLVLAVVLLTTGAYALLQASDRRGAAWVYLILIGRNLLTGAVPLVYLLRSSASSSGEVTGSLQVKRSHT